ncbi:MAG: signal peptidase I, partial [Lachnospiraceae bacterium]|nr:signal peptidase I [Lachnospiraceae bacterium]
SGSMETSIKTGSVAIVNDKYAYDKIDVGDVIAYKVMDNTLVTHRVIDMQDGVLETKGDNNEVSDGFVVNQENYKGLTVISIPYLGYLFAWIQTKKGLILTVTFVCAALLLEYAIDDTKDSSIKTNEKSE